MLNQHWKNNSPHHTWPSNQTQSTYLSLYLQPDAYPSSLAQFVNGDWWENSTREKGSSETNRDRSAPGSELPHYCTAAFCQPTSWQIHRNASDKSEFLLNVDNKSVPICRTNPTRQFLRERDLSSPWSPPVRGGPGMSTEALWSLRVEDDISFGFIGGK